MSSDTGKRNQRKFFNTILSNYMQRKPITNSELAELLNVSRHAIERVVNGTALPSDNLLRKMCTFFELDYHVIKTSVDADRICLCPELLDEVSDDPALLKVKCIWPYLNETQKGAIVHYAKALATSNRRKVNEL